MRTLTEIIGHIHSPSTADKEMIQNAYELATTAHHGASRYSGEPYMSHVSEVAYMLAEMGMGRARLPLAFYMM